MKEIQTKPSSEIDILAENEKLHARILELETKLKNCKCKNEYKDININLPCINNSIQYTPNHTLPVYDIKRYSRHILLPEIGCIKQEKLRNSKVLLIGAGGLGSPICLYLAAAGVGYITIIDHDVVDLSNQQRQIAFNENTINISKSIAAKQACININKNINVNAITESFNLNNAPDLVKFHDILIDATDNVQTRYLINDMAVLYNKFVVSGSAIRMEGQLTVYNAGDAPCYRCLYPSMPPSETLQSCNDSGMYHFFYLLYMYIYNIIIYYLYIYTNIPIGVLGIIPGIIGCLQALETLKILMGMPLEKCLVKRLLVFDGTSTNFRIIKLRSKNPNCIVCSNKKILKPIELSNWYNLPIKCSINNLPSSYEGWQESLLNIKPFKIPKIISCNKETQLFIQDFISIYNKENNYIFIDVRDISQYIICSLPNTINIPLSKILMELYSCRRDFIKISSQTQPLYYQYIILLAYKLFYMLLPNLFIQDNIICDDDEDSNNSDNIYSKYCPICYNSTYDENILSIQRALKDNITLSSDKIKIIILCRRGRLSNDLIGIINNILLQVSDVIHTIHTNTIVYNDTNIILPYFRVTKNILISLCIIKHYICWQNLQGGLTKYHHDIDTNFPLY